MRFCFRVLAALLLASLLAPAARALSPAWVPLGPFGGYVQALAADPGQSGTLYAVTTVGIFKTVDGGGTWTTSLLEPTLPGALTVDPAHSSTLYFITFDPTITHERVLKSTDGGASWTPAGAGLPNPRTVAFFAGLTVDPSDPRRLLLTYEHRLWRSVDGGGFWQPSTRGLPGGEPGTVAFAAHPAGTAFAATSAGLFRTADAGLSWKRMDRGLPVAFVQLLALAPSDPRTAYAYLPAFGLYRTADGGFSWQRAAAPSEHFGAALAVSPWSPRTLWASNPGGSLFRSTDGGAHWAPVSGVSGVTSVAFDAAAPQRVYAGSQVLPQGGVWRSDDGGASWARRSQGMTGLSAYELAVDPQHPDRLWTPVANSLYRSDDRGMHWVRATSPSGNYGVMQLTAAASSDLLAALSARPPGGGETPTVFKTADGGASWRPVLDRTQVEVRQIRVAPSEPATIYVIDGESLQHPQNRIWRSMDNGETWEALLPSLPSFCGDGDLTIAPSSAAVLYLARQVLTSRCERALFRSGDGGATWVSADTGLPAELAILSVAMDPRDPDLVYAGISADGIWKSTDGGRSWSPTDSELVGHNISILLASKVPDRLYTALGSLVLRSDDGSATWQDWRQGLQTLGVLALVADPGDPGRIYAATMNGVWMLKESD